MKERQDGIGDKAAIFAHIAARLHGVSTGGQGQWFEREGLDLRQQQAERAVLPIRWTSPLKKPRGRPGRKQAKLPWVIREWLDVREERLGLIKVLVVVKGEGRPPGPLLEQLSALPGVLSVTETATNRDLILLTLFRDSLEEEALRARIEELTNRPMHWEHVRSSTRLPSLVTWKHLAKKQGAADGISLTT